MRLEFENLTFSERDDRIRISFLKIYYCYIPKKKVEKLGEVTVERHAIIIDSNKLDANVEQKFYFLLSKAFEELYSTINQKPALYIHRHSAIPLMGSNAFGVIDRGTNTVEVKPLTTCNIDCIFCSVDHLKRHSDYVVEKDYLVDELRKVIAIKEHKVNVHIGSQGDPSLYGDLVELVRDIRAIDKVHAISMVTNGIIMTKSFADRLIEAGMTHFHVSLHATDREQADRLANAPYPVQNVMAVCRHIVKKAHLLLVPVWVPGINDEDIEDVVRFGKEIGADLGIQNFLEYRYGKKPARPASMDTFYDMLHRLEKKYDVKLTTLTSDLEFHEDNELPKPFRKGDVIEVEMKAPDRLKNSTIGVAKGRVVTVVDNRQTSGRLKVHILRDKHNIFVGKRA